MQLPYPERPTIHDSLGIEITDASPDRVVGTMPVGPRVHQPYGLLHGGASVVLAESLASIGTALNCGPGEIAVGLEINANHLRGKREGLVTGEALPLHRGRTTMVWEIKIRDEEDRMVCVSRCTVAKIPERQPSKA